MAPAARVTGAWNSPPRRSVFSASAREAFLEFRDRREGHRVDAPQSREIQAHVVPEVECAKEAAEDAFAFGLDLNRGGAAGHQFDRDVELPTTLRGFVPIAEHDRRMAAGPSVLGPPHEFVVVCLGQGGGEREHLRVFVHLRLPAFRDWGEGGGRIDDRNRVAQADRQTLRSVRANGGLWAQPLPESTQVVDRVLELGAERPDDPRLADRGQDPEQMAERPRGGSPVGTSTIGTRFLRARSRSEPPEV